MDVSLTQSSHEDSQPQLRQRCQPVRASILLDAVSSWTEKKVKSLQDDVSFLSQIPEKESDTIKDSLRLEHPDVRIAE